MTKQRQLLIGSCSLNDNKLEKNGTYEITLGKENDKYFECDALKGVANAGQEAVVNFKFKPPPPDPILVPKFISVIFYNLIGRNRRVKWDRTMG